MSRFGDKGPYSIENVLCQTNSSNQKEQPKNGTSPRGVKNGQAKLTEIQVLRIFYSKQDKHVLAKKYGVSTWQITHIKEGKRWGHLTSNVIGKGTGK